MNAVQYNPYTEPTWQAAVKQFEFRIHPAEERVAAKLKHQLRNANLNTLQVSWITWEQTQYFNQKFLAYCIRFFLYLGK